MDGNNINSVDHNSSNPKKSDSYKSESVYIKKIDDDLLSSTESVENKNDNNMTENTRSTDLNDDISHKQNKKKDKKYINYSTSKGLSFFFFSWMTNWIKLASKGNVKHQEFPDLPYSDFDQYSTHEFGILLDDYRDYDKCNRLVKFIGRSRLCVLKVFKKNFILLFCFSIFNDVFEVFNIFLLKHVMKQKMPNTINGLFKYLALVLLVLCVNLVDIVTDGHHHFYYRRLVLRIENLLFSFLFSRILSKNYYNLTDLPNGQGSSYKRLNTDGSVSITMLPRLHNSSNLLDSTNNIKIERKASRLHIEETEDHNWRGEDDISLLNLALFDISEIAWGILKLVDLCTIPLKIIIVGCWLYYQVGPTSLKAVVFILISSVLMILSEIQSAKLVKGYVTRIDDRILKTLTILENLTNFKMFRWISLCRDSVLKSRIMELQLCMKRTVLSSIGSWLGISLPNILALAVFLIYSTNNKNGVTLDPSFSIPLLHTLNHFIKPFRDLPSDLSDHLETTISCNRIESFLFSKQLKTFIDTSYSDDKTDNETVSEVDHDSEDQLNSPDDTGIVKLSDDAFGTGRTTIIDELPTDELKQIYYEAKVEGKVQREVNRIENLETTARLESVERAQDKPSSETITTRPDKPDSIKAQESPKNLIRSLVQPENRCVIHMKEASFFRGDKKVFNRLSFRLNSKDKVIISGSNISEKFLFTMALIDELRHTEGYYYNYYINNNMCTGIVSQNPWIPMGTVRDIILFGNRYNRRLYNKVIDICQLKYDFSNWKLNDLRFVDEGGQNLSTGQKVRISLARSLYTLNIAQHESGSSTSKSNASNSSSKSTSTTNSNGSMSNGVGNLIILDEIFTVLDPIIGLNIFNNLFGPNGILNDFTCVITVQDNFINILKDFEFDEYFKFYNVTNSSIHSIAIDTTLLTGTDELLNSYNKTVPEDDPVIWDSNEQLMLAIGRNSGVAEDRVPLIDGADELWNASEQPEQETLPSGHDEILLRSELFNPEKEGNVQLVKWENFVWYLKKVNLRLVSLVIAVSFMAMLLNVGSDIVVSKWTSAPAQLSEITDKKLVIMKVIYNTQYLRKLNFLYLFTFMTSCTIVLFLWRALLEVQGTLNAAHKVYYSALNGILKCPIVIFNKIPIGNINNRLSADQSYADYSIFRRFSHFMSSFIFTVLTAISLCYLNPWTVILIPLLILMSYFFVFKMYIPMSIFNMRSNLETRGYICGQFSQVISGSHIIKSLNNERYVLNNFLRDLKIHQNTKFFNHAASSWTMIRLRILTYPLIVINLLIPLMPIIKSRDFNSLYNRRVERAERGSGLFGTGTGSGLKNDMVDGKVGLALTYSYKFAKLLKSTLSKIVELETEMCASQRLQELAKLDPDYNINDERLIDSKKLEIMNNIHIMTRIKEINKHTSIATSDKIRRGISITGAEDLYLDYFEGLEVKKAVVKYDSKICLNEISFKSQGNEHIGLIGRTGAGKSTLLLSLGGLIKLESGSIKIDGKDISILTNGEMKEMVAILPHTPPLLPGWTIRKYVDPDDEHTDEEILKGAKKCKLETFLTHILETSQNGTFLDSGNSYDPLNKPDEGNARKVTKESIESYGSSLEDEYDNLYGELYNNTHSGEWREQASDLKKVMSIKITKQKENNYTILSDFDLQYLTLLRLYLSRRKLRLILIDECFSVEKDNSLNLEPINVIINRLFKNNIVIIVAHHQESLSLCNRVLLLEGGRIVETDIVN